MKIRPMWFAIAGGIILLAGTISGYYFWAKSQDEVQAWDQSSFDNEIIIPIDNALANITTPTNSGSQTKKPPINNSQDNSDPTDDTNNDPNPLPSSPTNEDSDQNGSSGGDSSNQTPWEQGPSDQ